MELSTEFICVNEIWSAQTISSTIENYYEPIFKHRTTNQAGGVGIYVRNGITFRPNLLVNQVKCKVIEHTSIDAKIDKPAEVVPADSDFGEY